MASDYAIEIDGDEFHPIPESWLDHPMAVDAQQPDSPPRIYAVSAALRTPRVLVTRYAHPITNEVLQYTGGAMEGPEGEGYVPANLREAGQTWARSLVPSDEPQDELRLPEEQHFEDIWSHRIDLEGAAGMTIADGSGGPR